MADSAIEDLDTRRRRARFRAWHRGQREMDLILGRFVDEHLAGLTVEEMDELEALLDMIDRDLFAWFSGETPVPADVDGPLYRRIKAFHTHSGPVNL